MPTPLPPNPPNRAYGTTPAAELPPAPAEDADLFNKLVEVVTPADTTEPEAESAPEPEIEDDGDTAEAPAPKAPLPRPDWGPDKG